MSAVDEILSQVPVDQLAAQVGGDPASTEAAARGAVQALLGGLHANAQDPAGEESLAKALGDHDPQLIEGGVNLSDVDANDGQKIVSHIFGGAPESAIAPAASIPGVDNALVQKLLPILAPIVLAYVAQQLNKQGGLGGVLGGILGKLGGQQQPQAGGLGGLLGQILGGQR